VSGVPSPCNKVCILDPATQVCIGCLRTIDEIARWNDMNEEEKARVVAVARERKEQLGPR
jgi:predicted Fe-S protein YdhL (DUF1289 family)